MSSKRAAMRLMLSLSLGMSGSMGCKMALDRRASWARAGSSEAGRLGV